MEELLIMEEVKAYASLRFTRMIDISGAGIGVSE